MDSLSFCYWLQGTFELGKLKSLDEEQTRILKDHLQLVFSKVTPDYSNIKYCNPGQIYTEYAKGDIGDGVQYFRLNPPSGNESFKMDVPTHTC